MSEEKYWTYWTTADKREKEVEDSLRMRYCSDENCKDGDALLVDISEEPIVKKESPYTHLFPKSSAISRRPYTVGDKVTVTINRLEEILEGYFCGNILKQFSNNIVLAGGMLVSCLDAQTGGTALASSPHLDADFFVYGLNPDGTLSQKEVRDKFDDIVRNFIEKLVQARHAKYKVDIWSIVMLRTEDSITLMIPINGDDVGGIYPLNVQIILRDYRDKFHILSGFDVPACAVLYDGHKVLALPRAVTAIERQENLVDTHRQSLTFETRLLKYQNKKGFAIVVPGADTNKLMVSSLLDNDLETCGGLVKMILSMIKGLHSQNESSYCMGHLKLDMKDDFNFIERVYNSLRSNLKNGSDRHVVMASCADYKNVGAATLYLLLTRGECAMRIYNILISKRKCVDPCTNSFPSENASTKHIPSWVSDPTILKRGDANSFRPILESGPNWFTGAECML